jgi:hypothetical protein
MSRWKILASVSDWLKLLALIIIAVEGLLATIIATKKEEDPFPYVVLGLSLFALIVVGIFVDRYWQGRKKTALSNDSSSLAEGDRMLPQDIGSEEFDQFLNACREDFRRIAEFKNKAFKSEVSQGCNQFRLLVKRWQRGQLMVASDEAERVLVAAYRSAEKKVFSTSVPDYLHVWMSPYGDTLIQAHKESNAKQNVTRIFVFGNRDELTEDFLKVMKKQDDAGIRVRLYFDQEDMAFNFPPETSKDFTVIDDGLVIGKTVTFGDNQFAEWNFEDTDAGRIFNGYVKSLSESSLSLKDFESWQSKNE